MRAYALSTMARGISKQLVCLKYRESNPPGWVCDSSARGKLSCVETCSDVSLEGNDKVCNHTVADKLEKCHTIVQAKSYVFSEEHLLDEETFQLSQVCVMISDAVLNAYDCREGESKQCHFMGVSCLHDSGLKTADLISVVSICNSIEWLSASCPTAPTAMAFPAAPAPDITEKWFGPNGLSIYAPKNITLQIKIGLEIYKRLISNLSDNAMNMGAGGPAATCPGS